MSFIQGRKCDHCGVEQHEQVRGLDEPQNMCLAQEATPPVRPWMEIHWQRVMHLCPNCAEVANKAMGFARDIRR
ncbi:MAG: hypothetical protein WBA09_22195 [Candidatus Acidiferrum sp.]